MSLIHSTTVLDTSTTGTITALNGTVQLAFQGHQSAAAVITGTWDATLVIEGSCDGGTSWSTCWFSTVNQSLNALGIPTPSNNTTANGIYKIFNTSGVTHYRVRASIFTTGTVNVVLQAVNAPSSFTYMSGSIIQSVVGDSANSNLDTNFNLASGASYTGTSSSTLGVAGIQVSLKTDQNCNVYIDQSPDGTNWDISDNFEYYYTLGGNSWTVQAVNSYYRVRVTNTGTLTTTYFRLQTALCPIVEAVPRALSAEGNLKVGVYEIEGQFGTKVEVTPMSQMRVTENIRLIGTSFSGTIFDTNFWVKTTQVGTGDATLANGQCTLATGTTANSLIIVNSKISARYVPSNANYFRGIIGTPSVTGENVRRWGAFDAQNGYFFQCNGTTLSVVCRKNGSDANIISSGSFNGTYGSIYSPNANAHSYEIHWTNKTVYFTIDGDLIHKFSGLTTTLTDTLALKVGLECTNSGGNVNNNILEVRSSTISRLGQALTRPVFYNIANVAETRVLKYSGGCLHRIVINQAGGNNASIVIYDNTAGSGSIISTIQTNSASVGSTFAYEVDFSIGLTYVSSLNPGNITIIYE